MRGGVEETAPRDECITARRALPPSHFLPHGLCGLMPAVRAPGESREAPAALQSAGRHASLSASPGRRGCARSSRTSGLVLHRWAGTGRPPTEHHFPHGRRHGVRGPGQLQPRFQDPHAVDGRAGCPRDALHGCPLGLGRVHADPVRGCHRPLRLAEPSQERRALRLLPCADRAGPDDRRQHAAEPGLPHGGHRQMASRP